MTVLLVVCVCVYFMLRSFLYVCVLPTLIGPECVSVYNIRGGNSEIAVYKAKSDQIYSRESHSFEHNGGKLAP